jgi:hypothetical protein
MGQFNGNIRGYLDWYKNHDWDTRQQHPIAPQAGRLKELVKLKVIDGGKKL